MTAARSLALALVLSLGCSRGDRSSAKTASSTRDDVTVGKNVQVSAANANYSHAEVMIDADPNDANRLIACAMVSQPRVNQGWHVSERTITYISHDGGSTWQPTMEYTGPKDYPVVPPTENTPYSGDPSCTFGPNGTAYSAAILPGQKMPIGVRRSLDGGKTWGEMQTIRQVGDRAWLTVDRTAGKFKGRVYLAGGDGIAISDTGGTYYQGGSRHVKTIDEDVKTYSDNSSGVVLSDGTYVDLMWQPVNQMGPSAPFRMNHSIILSSDGGKTFTEPMRAVSGALTCPHEVGADVSTIAADANPRSLFHDRIYVTWSHYDRRRCAVFITHTYDRGKTWSSPIQVNDDRPNGIGGPNDFMGTVAVNKDGTVGVMWYDRRDTPDKRGYTVRFAYSLDGGDTFSPSVQVSEGVASWAADKRFTLHNANRGRYAPNDHRLELGSFDFGAGNNAGMAADANGVFRPVWIDNRTGVMQAWTAPVSVKGNTVVNGDSTVATFRDVSNVVRVDIVDIVYDGKRGEVTANAYLTNTSKDAIKGPIKVRAIAVKSDAGEIRVENADNGVEKNGAVWDFTEQLEEGGLPPGKQTSKPKRLVFSVRDVIPFWDPLTGDFGWYPAYVHLVTRVLAAP
jgi:hypothetical protein